MPSLSLRTYARDESVRVALGGELDLSSAISFDEALRRIEGEHPDEPLVLDLSSLKFLDSTGLRLIVAAHTRAKRAGRRLVIVEGTAAVQRIFRLTGVDSRLDVVQREADAEHSIQSGR